MYIGVTGVMGVGKTTLAQGLADHLGYAYLKEPANDNPYLSDYYDDMWRWAFEFDTYLYAHSIGRYTEANRLRSQGVVTDQAPCGDLAFTKVRRDIGALDYRAMSTLSVLQRQLCGVYGVPDLVIHLVADVGVIAARIQARGRLSEQDVSQNYLHALDGALYETVEQSKLAGARVLRLDWGIPMPVEDVVCMLDSCK